MTTISPPAAPPATLPDAGARGGLTIHERVVERTAERVTAETTGWAHRPSGWHRVGGTALPHAEATIVGRHVRVAMTVGAGSDQPLPAVAWAVRTAVARHVNELTGLEVDKVDVRVKRLTGAPPPGTPAQPAAAPPAAAGPARRAGVLLALLLIAAGAVAVYDMLAGLDAIDGPLPVEDALDRIDGLQPQEWMVPAGIVLALAGLWLALSALRPRPRRVLPLRAASGVYATRRAIEHIAVDTATQHPGVIDAHARARRRAVAVRLHTDGEAATAGEVRGALVDRLDHVEGAPKIRVSTRRAGGSR